MNRVVEEARRKAQLAMFGQRVKDILEQPSSDSDPNEAVIAAIRTAAKDYGIEICRLASEEVK